MLKGKRLGGSTKASWTSRQVNLSKRYLVGQFNFRHVAIALICLPFNLKKINYSFRIAENWTVLPSSRKFYFSEFPVKFCRKLWVQPKNSQKKTLFVWKLSVSSLRDRVMFNEANSRPIACLFYFTNNKSYGLGFTEVLFCVIITSENKITGTEGKNITALSVLLM